MPNSQQQQKMGTNPTDNPTVCTAKSLSFVKTESQISAAASGGGSGACAVCKYQRRKCPPDCPLAPHFPAYKQKDFLNVHKLFGVRNLTRALGNIDKRNRHDFMVSVIYEANARAADPVGGCRAVINNLNSQLYYSTLELGIVNQKLAFCRSKNQELQMAAAAAAYNHAGFEGSSSDQVLSDCRDLICAEKQQLRLVCDQRFPYAFAEKPLEAELPFESAGAESSVKLSEGTIVKEGLIKVEVDQGRR